MRTPAIQIGRNEEWDVIQIFQIVPFAAWHMFDHTSPFWCGVRNLPRFQPDTYDEHLGVLRK